MQICIERSDTCAYTVRGRIEFAQDLHATDAIYHPVCSTNFRTSKQQLLPSTFQATLGKNRRIGRRIDTAKEDAFLTVTKYLEDNNDEQITIRDLLNKTRDMCEHDVNVNSEQHMKRKLADHFGSSIVIDSINGKADVVSFRSTASTILREFYDTPKDEDTDVLVLLCHHAETQTQKLYYRSEGKRNPKSIVWDIHSLQRAFGSEVCRLLPIANELAGCDTTSRLFGIRMGVALRKLNIAPTFKQMAEVFCGKE